MGFGQGFDIHIQKLKVEVSLQLLPIDNIIETYF